jgi:hypothetical protein
MDPIAQFFLKFLQPGDVLLFRRKGFFNMVIEHATNAPVSHTEVFAGNGITYGCRNGIGVDRYTFEPDGLAVILRPITPFNNDAANRYQTSVLKQGYDWTGLWRAFVANTWGRNSTKQWCSENSTNVLRAGGVEPFGEHVPADMVAPGDFLKSPAFTRVWTSKGFPV